MNPNTNPNQPAPIEVSPQPEIQPIVSTETQYPPQPQQFAEPPQPVMQQQPAVNNLTPAKTDKSLIAKIAIIVSMAVLIIGGVAAYLWRDSQANIQKTEDAAKIKTLEDKITTIEKVTGPITQEVLDRINNLEQTTPSSSSESDSKQKTSRAFSNATSAQQVAEIMAAETNRYPSITADFVTGTTIAKLASDVTVLPGKTPTLLNAGNGTTTIAWECLDVCDKTIGGRITYWDFTTNNVSALYVGVAKSTSKFVTPAS